MDAAGRQTHAEKFTPIAVIPVNMGGPDHLDEVEEFLTNIFRDPILIRIPLKGWFRERFARWLAAKRAPKSRKIYEDLGGTSPLNAIARGQVDALQQELDPQKKIFRVYNAMRYWKPFMEEAWNQALDDGCKTVIWVSMYPFYSCATTGSLSMETLRLLKERNFSKDHRWFVESFGQKDFYLDSIEQAIRKAVDESGIERVLLTAHSIPQKLVDKGDPYEKQVRQCYEDIASRFPDIKMHLSFQSKIGPVRWLGPATEEELEAIRQEGADRILVYPLGFVADNSETAHEIAIEYAEAAREMGYSDFRVIPAPNTDPVFINGLANMIKTLSGFANFEKQ